MGRKKSKQPNFNHSSWDTTIWSLWGVLYSGAESDRELKQAITQHFSRARTALGGLGRQVDPMKSLVAGWNEELTGYVDEPIRYGVAQDVLDRLVAIADEAEQQVESDRQLVKTGSKPEARESDEDESTSDDDETDEAWAERFANSSFGHTKATAKTRPRVVKSTWKPPTPEEVWAQQQRDMATQCDSSINYGEHEVTQHSVLSRLNPAEPPVSGDQRRPGPENSHIRIIWTDGGVFWTLGLTHSDKRDKGEFCVYRRNGTGNTFTFVSGQRHPKDPQV